MLAHLTERYRHSSASTWGARLAAGEVSIEGALAAPTDILRAGHWLVWRRPAWEEPPVLTLRNSPLPNPADALSEHAIRIPS